MIIRSAQFGSKTLCVCCALLLLAACAAQPAPETQTAALGQLGHRGNGKNANIDALRTRLTRTDHGLEVRRWTLPATSGELSDALASFIDGHAADDSTLDRLARNGLRFVRVPIERIDSLQDALDGLSVASNEWHGQATQWRSLQERPIGGISRALAIDGRAQRFDRGSVRLNMRAWTVLMEDGPHMHLELVPEYRIPRPQDYRQLLGQAADSHEAFTSIALDALLDSRFAYVLLSKAPKATKPASSREEGSPPSSPPRVGLLDFTGPPAQPPLTIGEWLMQSDADPDGRVVLIFVPRIPASMFPQGSRANGS